jgi:hypothetical protein
MEQRIELFYCQYASGNAFAEAKGISDDLAKRGWYIHDTCLATTFDSSCNNTSHRLMVTYRRKECLTLKADQDDLMKLKG